MTSVSRSQTYPCIVNLLEVFESLLQRKSNPGCYEAVVVVKKWHQGNERFVAACKAIPERLILRFPRHHGSLRFREDRQQAAILLHCLLEEVRAVQSKRGGLSTHHQDAQCSLCPMPHAQSWTGVKGRAKTDQRAQ